MRAFFFVVAALVAFAAHASGEAIDVAQLAQLHNGDVILHTSTSSQAPAIIIASASRYSHTGVIEVSGSGKDRRAFVIEASGSVRRTPLQAFINRGLGGAFTVIRHQDVDDDEGRAIVRAAKKHLGKPYDLSFARGDAALYCSELVVVAYAAAGIDVGTWEKLSDLHLDKPVARKLMERRWRKHPACRGAKTFDACLPHLLETEVVTPASLRDDDAFDVVMTTFPAGLG